MGFAVASGTQFDNVLSYNNCNSNNHKPLYNDAIRLEIKLTTRAYFVGAFFDFQSCEMSTSHHAVGITPANEGITLFYRANQKLRKKNDSS